MFGFREHAEKRQKAERRKQKESLTLNPSPVERDFKPYLRL